MLTEQVTKQTKESETQVEICCEAQQLKDEYPFFSSTGKKKEDDVEFSLKREREKRREEKRRTSMQRERERQREIK